MELTTWREPIARAMEVAGVAVIVVGTLAATARFVVHAFSAFDPAYRTYRRNIGRAILLGLELLVAADIINTVAVDPTYRSVGVLAIIVAIRTFLSFSLEVEIEGRWPWARARHEDERGGSR